MIKIQRLTLDPSVAVLAMLASEEAFLCLDLVVTLTLFHQSALVMHAEAHLLLHLSVRALGEAKVWIPSSLM